MFDGRKDFQIKHLGNRIELGEIETAALSTDRVRRACALYDTEGGRIIIFYTGSCEEKELRKYLNQKLPRYMVPSAYHKLDEMPLNDNGKIDRQLLKRKNYT
jgi:acyl-coenzyme A synthetase/AMP-(fatty) acid ligase